MKNLFELVKHKEHLREDEGIILEFYSMLEYDVEMELDPINLKIVLVCDMFRYWNHFK